MKLFKYFCYDRKVSLCILSLLMLWFMLVATKDILSQEWIVVRKGIGRSDIGGFGFSQMHFPDANNGWAVSFQDPWGDPSEETIIYTKDGGTTWGERMLKDKELVGIDYKPGSVYFLNNHEGWIGGTNVIAHTTNGGETWQIIKVDYEGKPRGVRLRIGGIYFVSEKEGWVIGQGYELSNVYGMFILHTVDGGISWQAQIPVSDSYNDSGLWDIDFISPKEGWAVGVQGGIGDGIVLHTTNGGEKWELLNSAHSLLDVDFVDAKEGWAPTYYSNDYQFFIRHTTDGGYTWEGQNIPLDVEKQLKPATLYGVSFANGNIGWAVGAHGIILNTRNGGKAWQLQESGMDIDLVDVQYVPGNGVFALGIDGTILRQEDITAVKPQEKLIVTWGRIKRR